MLAQAPLQPGPARPAPTARSAPPLPPAVARRRRCRRAVQRDGPGRRRHPPPAFRGAPAPRSRLPACRAPPAPLPAVPLPRLVPAPSCGPRERRGRLSRAIRSGSAPACPATARLERGQGLGCAHGTLLAPSPQAGPSPVLTGHRCPLFPKSRGPAVLTGPCCRSSHRPGTFPCGTPLSLIPKVQGLTFPQRTPLSPIPVARDSAVLMGAS